MSVSHYEAFTFDYVHMGYNCPVIVFITPKCVMFNLGNIAKFLNDNVNAFHTSWGTKNFRLEKYRRKHLSDLALITTNLWMNWHTLQELLYLDDPDGDHRLTWWTGLEPQWSTREKKYFYET